MVEIRPEFVFSGQNPNPWLEAVTEETVVDQDDPVYGLQFPVCQTKAEETKGHHHEDTTSQLNAHLG